MSDFLMMQLRTALQEAGKAESTDEKVAALEKALWAVLRVLEEQKGGDDTTG